MKTPQNVLKMSIVRPDSKATDWWLQQQSNGPAFCIWQNSLYFSSAKRHYHKTSHV